jgi:hypothetical protein
VRLGAGTPFVVFCSPTFLRLRETVAQFLPAQTQKRRQPFIVMRRLRVSYTLSFVLPYHADTVLYPISLLPKKTQNTEIKSKNLCFGEIFMLFMDKRFSYWNAFAFLIGI